MALTKTDVSALYVAIFNRASEGEGNTYWQTQGTTAEVANAMLDTAPAKEYFGAALDDDQAFIEHIYLNTLGKTLADDAEGIEFWTGELATQSRGEVIARLIESALDAATAGPAQDKFKNMIAVSDYAAETLEDAPEDLTDLRFDGGLQGVTADADSVEAAKTKVNLVLNPVDPLTQALNELDAAKKDLTAFVEAADKSELVLDLKSDVSTVQTAAVSALAGEAGIVLGTDSPAVIQAKIGDTVTKLNDDLTAAQKTFSEASAEVAKVAGLPAALLQLAAATEAKAATAKTKAAADVAYNAEEAKFIELNKAESVAVAAVLDTTAAPKLKDGVTEAKYPGVTALLSAAQAQFAAEVADTNAGIAQLQANAAVLYLDAQPGAKDAIKAAITDSTVTTEADKLTQKQIQDALNKALEDADGDVTDGAYVALNSAVAAFESSGLYGDTAAAAMTAKTGVETAEKAVKDFNEKVADLVEATALKAELEAKQAAVEDATDAFEELGVEAPLSIDTTVVATVGNDLFLSDKAGTVINFGQQGEDRLWVGEANELVVLGASNNINTQPLGDKDVLEVFAKQQAGGVELWVEKQAFAGNATGIQDLVKITLSGVSVDDLVLEDGFLSIA